MLPTCSTPQIDCGATRGRSPGSSGQFRLCAEIRLGDTEGQRTDRSDRSGQFGYALEHVSGTLGQSKKGKFLQLQTKTAEVEWRSKVPEKHSRKLIMAVVEKNDSYVFAYSMARVAEEWLDDEDVVLQWSPYAAGTWSTPQSDGGASERGMPGSREKTEERSSMLLGDEG